MRIPASLDWLAATTTGRAWLAVAPELVAEACRRWTLQPGEPFDGGHCSIALPVTDAAGRAAVLKLQFPDRESEHEAAALAAWKGDGAVRLLDHAADLHALLLERCVPGHDLTAAEPTDALDVLTSLIPRLGVTPAGPFTSITHEAAHWSRSLPATWERAGRPYEIELIDTTLELLDRLPATQGPEVLVHQDLHPGNVLRAEREPWLVIDPKPLAAELAFAVAPVVRAPVLGHSRTQTLARLQHLCDALSLDLERARDWTVAQTMAWSFNDLEPLTTSLDTARWLLDA